MNTAAISEITLSEEKLEEAIAAVRLKVTQRLDRCKEILLILNDLPIDEAKLTKRQEAFFSLSCVVEFLASRV